MTSTTRLDRDRTLVRAGKSGSSIEAILFANEDVPIDQAGLAELEGFALLPEAIEALKAKGALGRQAAIGRIILTPDFHKGSGTPIGTVLEAHGLVLPGSIGGDIGCGMRLLVTDLTADEAQLIAAKASAFDALARRADSQQE